MGNVHMEIKSGRRILADFWGTTQDRLLVLLLLELISYSEMEI